MNIPHSNLETLSPNVFMIAGCNGAGKTTASMTFLSDALHLDHFVNADEIARGLSPLNPVSASLDAGRLVIERIQKLIHQRQSFAFETTASGRNHLRTLQKCLGAGYRVHILFFYLSSEELAIERVQTRVAQGGHDVPKEDIGRRYKLGLRRLFQDYIPLAHEVTLFFNDDGRSEQIAKRQEQDNWTIFNPSLWLQIQEKVQ